jgi:uncharacterized protein (DUF488 family)
MPLIMSAREGPTQPPTGRLLSVGHSNHDWPRFLALLQGAGVTAVADVRSSPYSRRLPQYNRAALEGALRANDIGYAYLGDLLGGRPADRDLYDPEGWADYARMRQTAAFRRGLDRLLLGTEDYTVAMLCGEEDPLDCHRGLMIAPALAELGRPPLHLRKDGSLETTADMEKRLLEATGVGAGLLDGLFAAHLDEAERRSLVAEAYRRRNRQVAYRLPGDEGEGA